MSYWLYFTDDARTDINEAYQWYEEQREALGDEFLESLNTTLKEIEEYPLHYQLQHKERLCFNLRI